MGEMFGQPTPTREDHRLKEPSAPSTPQSTLGAQNDLTKLFESFDTPSAETQERIKAIDTQIEDIEARMKTIREYELPETKLSRKLDRVLGPGGGATFMQNRVKQQMQGNLLQSFIGLARERRLLTEPNQAQVEMFKRTADLLEKDLELGEANAVADQVEGLMQQGKFRGYSLDPGNWIAFRETGKYEYLTKAMRSPEDRKEIQKMNTLSLIGTRLAPEVLMAMKDDIPGDEFAIMYGSSVSKIAEEQRAKGIKWVSAGGDEYKGLDEIWSKMAPDGKSDRFRIFQSLMARVPYKRVQEGAMPMFGGTTTGEGDAQISDIHAVDEEGRPIGKEKWLEAGRIVLNRIHTLNGVPVHEVMGGFLAREEPELLELLQDKPEGPSASEVFLEDMKATEDEAEQILKEMTGGGGTTDDNEGTDG